MPFPELKHSLKMGVMQPIEADFAQFGQFPELVRGARIQEELVGQFSATFLDRQLQLIFATSACGQISVEVEQLEEVLFRVKSVQFGQEFDFIAAFISSEVLEQPAAVVQKDAPTRVVVGPERAGTTITCESGQSKSIHQHGQRALITQKFKIMFHIIRYLC
jgi:hypothetical protein